MRSQIYTSQQGKSGTLPRLYQIEIIKHFYIYHLKGENRSLTTIELIDFYEELINKYPIISIEDPVDENDWEGFRLITEKIGEKIQLVGDDLFVTNKKCLQKGIDNHAGNAILLKVNQIGTITETIDTTYSIF